MLPRYRRILSILTLETVSRALSQLHAQGVLGFSGARQILLRNRARLRNIDACE
jgi:CRP/FNR family nitrogen fixation transcriptional regulator